MSCKFLKNALLTCGASIALIGAANAGEYKLQVRDVDGAPGVDGTGQLSPAGEITVEKSGHVISAHRKVSVSATDEHPFPLHVELELSELVFTEEGTLSPVTHLVNIELLGDTVPVWKNDFTPAQIVRDGTDSIESTSITAITDGPFTPANLLPFLTNDTGVDSEFEVQAGTNTASFTLNPNTEGENALGFSLPVALTNCDEGDTFNVRVTIVNLETGFTVTDETGLDEHPDILTCEDPSFEAQFVALNDQKVEYNTTPNNAEFIVPDDGFLIESEDGFLDGFQGTTLSLTSTPFGFVNLSVKNQLTSTKFPEGDEGKYDDAGDILSTGIEDTNGYRITWNFKDTTGLASISAFTVDDEGNIASDACDTQLFPAVPQQDYNFIFDLHGEDVIECFGLDGDDDSDVEKGGKQDGVVMFVINATGTGGIVSQSVDLVSHVIELETIEDEATGSAVLGNPEVSIDGKYELVELQMAETDIFRIVRNGLQFGPFDWVTLDNGRFFSIFRVSGLPPILDIDDHGQVIQDGVEQLIGTVHISNSSVGADGFCEFDITGIERAVTETGETLFNLPLLNAILGDLEFPAGSGNFPSVHCSDGIIESRDPATGIADFGRGDLLFTWFLPSRFQQNVDMDRLLITGDLAASYGDNGNDAFSVAARSCDAGRFGPDVVNRLSGSQADVLSFLCTTGGPIIGDGAGATGPTLFP